LFEFSVATPSGFITAVTSVSPRSTGDPTS
jgi:hypothetical protein